MLTVEWQFFFYKFSYLQYLFRASSAQIIGNTITPTTSTILTTKFEFEFDFECTSNLSEANSAKHRQLWPLSPRSALHHPSQGTRDAPVSAVACMCRRIESTLTAISTRPDNHKWVIVVVVIVVLAVVTTHAMCDSFGGSGSSSIVVTTHASGGSSGSCSMWW